MSEGARRAAVHDLDRLAELAELAVAEQRSARGGYVWSRRDIRSTPYRVSLESAFHDPDQELWVGTIDDVVLGYAVCRLEVLRTGEFHGVLDDFFVEPDAREVGIGEAMIDLIVAWCRERQCIGIDAFALPGNRETKNFFETFGFKARLITVHHPLIDQGTPSPSERLRGQTAARATDETPDA